MKAEDLVNISNKNLPQRMQSELENRIRKRDARRVQFEIEQQKMWNQLQTVADQGFFELKFLIHDEDHAKALKSILHNYGYYCRICYHHNLEVGWRWVNHLYISWSKEPIKSKKTFPVFKEKLLLVIVLLLIIIMILSCVIIY